MWKLLSNWRKERSQRRAAIKLAAERFEAVKGKQPHIGICGVIAKTGESYLVRVCYGHTKPQRRAWFPVPMDGSPVLDLTFEEVRPYGEKLLL